MASGLAGLAAARLAGADRIRSAERWAVPLVSFTPQAVAGAWASTLLLRGKGSRGTAALAGIALTAAVAPRAIPRRQPPADGPVLRVLTANLLVGRAASDAIVELVARKGADVLFLQELTEDAVTRLKQAGLTRLLPYEEIEAVPEGPRGSGIYARYPLRDGLAVPPGSPAGPAALLDVPAGQSVQLVCVHMHAPTPSRAGYTAARWRAELEMLPTPGDVPVILAGDFNSTLDHAPFRALLRLGYADAARQTGNGLIPTWGPKPGGRRALLTIDHVLPDSRCAVQATSVHRLPGSDHRAVYAEVRLPR